GPFRRRPRTIPSPCRRSSRTATWPTATSPTEPPAPADGTARPAGPGAARNDGTMMSPAPQHRDDSTRRRSGVVRTVWVVGVIAVAIYVGFILSGVLNT